MRQAFGHTVVPDLLQEVWGIGVTLTVIGVWERRKFITQDEGYRHHSLLHNQGTSNIVGQKGREAAPTCR